MKTTPRSRVRHTWLLIALGVCAALFVASLAPGAANARTRPENTQPLAGDPDTPESPYSGPAKAARFELAPATRSLITPSQSTSASHLISDRFMALATFWRLRFGGL